MTDSIAMRSTQPSISNVVSKSGAFKITVSGRADSASDLSVISVVVGKVGSPPPAVFSDFTSGSTITEVATSAQSVSWQINGLSQTYSLVTGGSLAGTVNPGDNVYVALFDVPAPATSDPVLAVTGPFVVVA